MKKSLAFIFLFVAFLAVPTALIFAQSTSSTSTGSLLGPKEGQGGCMEIELPYIPRCGATPASYLSGLYRLALVLGVLAALIMIVIAGITYATSGDNASKQKEARGQIKDAIIGMVILFASVLILNTVNPALVSMRLPNIQPPSTPAPTSTSTSSEPSDSGSLKDRWKRAVAEASVVECMMGSGTSGKGGCVDRACSQFKDNTKFQLCSKACQIYCEQKYHIHIRE